MGKFAVDFMNVVKNNLYTGHVGDSMTPAGVIHPIDLYKALKKGNKNVGVGTKRHPLATVAKTRLLCGPELNLLFLGVPFALVCLHGTVQLRAARANKPVQRAVHATQAPPKFKVKAGASTTPNSGGTSSGQTALSPIVTGVAAPAPLNSSPYSSDFVNLNHRLVAKGMSRDSARRLTGGELCDTELAAELSEADLTALVSLVCDLKANIEAVEGDGVFTVTAPSFEITDFHKDARK